MKARYDLRIWGLQWIEKADDNVDINCSPNSSRIRYFGKLIRDYNFY